MQDETLVSLVLLEGELIDARILPLLQPLGLVLGEVCPHRKAGARQVRRLFVVRHLPPFLVGAYRQAPKKC